MTVERESDVQRKIMNVCKKYGCYVYKNAQNMYTEKGRPDLAACVPTTVGKLVELFGMDGKVGLFLGMELKRDGHLDEVSLAQEVVGRKIKKANGIWIATDDPDVIEALMLKITEVKDGV